MYKFNKETEILFAILSESGSPKYFVTWKVNKYELKFDFAINAQNSAQNLRYLVVYNCFYLTLMHVCNYAIASIWHLGIYNCSKKLRSWEEWYPKVFWLLCNMYKVNK